MATTLPTTTPAGAHTALLQASPGPDETVGGPIEGIELRFLEPVTNAVVTVTYNGEVIAGITTVSDGETIRFEFASRLENPGRYQVFYEMISFDADYTTSGYFFTYALGAPQPAEVEQPSEGSSFPLVASVIAITAVVALLGVFVWRLDDKRRPPVDDDSGYDGDSGYDDPGGFREYQ